jgi:predicted tellurium resistance membrane protein TerC
MLLALLAIATTDLVFALDSIPAVFGVTRHAYIVFAANAFALLGLRALYFLVSGLLDRLVYLSSGLAVVLAEDMTQTDVYAWQRWHVTAITTDLADYVSGLLDRLAPTVRDRGVE